MISIAIEIISIELNTILIYYINKIKYNII